MGCDSDHIGSSLNLNKDSPQSLPKKNMPTNFDSKFYFSNFLLFKNTDCHVISRDLTERA